MAPKRVVVINDLSQAMGGATGLALLSARQFTGAGLDVTYVCGDAGHGENAGGATVVAAGSAQLLKRSPLDAMRRGVYNPRTRDMLARLIEQTDTPDTVYHLHGWAQILSPSVFDALAPVAARTFVHAHDMFLACPNGVYMDYRRNQVCTLTPLGLSCLSTNCDKRSLMHKGWRVLRQKAVTRAFRRDLPWAGIIAIHPAMLPRLARAGYGDDMFQVVRNPAAAFSPTRVPAERNARLVYVGRLEADKGALDLAQAAARTGMDVTFIGEGSLRATLERDFPHMPITGWQDREAVGALLQDARALVMPSRHPEPFALVIPEAVLSGLPVAVADTALMAQDVTDKRLGLSFDVFDPALFDATLIRLRDMSPDAMREMSERGFSGDDHLAHTAATWSDALIRLYEAVV